MCFHIHISFLVVFISSVTFCNSCTPRYGLRVSEFDDKKISQSVMWTRNNLTKAECLAECYKETYCLSVHFSPVEPACVALRERFEGVSVANTPTAGYQLFQTKKVLPVPGSDCEIDVDCVSLSNSHCHEGGCRCDIGYGFNGSSCRSLADCSVFADNFTMYTQSVIVGMDVRSSGGKTRPTCMQFCVDYPTCKSADFDFVGSICYLQEVTWLEAPVGILVTNSPIFDFYQRECQTWT